MSESRKLGKVLQKRLRMLEESESPDAIKELLGLLSKNSDLWWESRKILEEKVSRKHADILIDYLNSDEKKTAAAIDTVIELLGNIKSVKAIPAISRYLHHKKLYVRMGVALELGEIGSKKGIPTLLAALDDPNCVVFKFACDALTWINDESAIPYLQEKLAQSKTYIDKLYLSNTLCLIEGCSKLDNLLKYLEFGSSKRLKYIRTETIEALYLIASRADIKIQKKILKSMEKARDREEVEEIKSKMQEWIDWLHDLWRGEV